MRSKIEIEFFWEYEKLNFYTLKFKDEETEMDKFLDKFPEGCKYDKDIDIIFKWIEKIGNHGALERFFRQESKISDNIWAIPIEKSSLRLYVIRLSEDVIILGNGGVKITKTYNEDPILNSYVKLLQEVDGYIKARIKSGKLSIYQKQLFGNLTFILK